MYSKVVSVVRARLKFFFFFFFLARVDLRFCGTLKDHGSHPEQFFRAPGAFRGSHGPDNFPQLSFSLASAFLTPLLLQDLLSQAQFGLDLNFSYFYTFQTQMSPYCNSGASETYPTGSKNERRVGCPAYWLLPYWDNSPHNQCSIILAACPCCASQLVTSAIYTSFKNQGREGISLWK